MWWRCRFCREKRIGHGHTTSHAGKVLTSRHSAKPRRNGVAGPGRGRSHRAPQQLRRHRKKADL